MSNGLPGLDLGSNWTPLTRNVIVALFAIYVVQLLSGGVVEQWLAWQPFEAGFRPWQVATAFVLSGPSPLWAVLSWLGVFFFLAPVESALGRRAFLQAAGIVWATSVVVSAALLAAGVVSLPGAFLGIGPLLGALTAVFGFLHPHAQILLYVIPVRAIWIAWGTGLFAFLYLLFNRDLGSALAFFAWCTAAGYVAVRNGAARRVQLRWKKRQIERKLGRFEVIEGGRKEKRPRRTNDPGDWVH